MKAPVIIIGMHRSGTSLVSSLLHRSGIYMGADQDENAESQLFFMLNEWMLVQAGATWDNPYNFDFINDDFSTHLVKALKRQLEGKSLKKYLGAERRGYKSYHKIDFDWGWKDPRNTFTIDIWKKIFDDAKVIHVYRNPVDVAASLRSRAQSLKEARRKKYFTGFKRRRLENRLTHERIYEQSLRGLHLEEGYKMWEEYLQKALIVETRTGFETLHIRYEDLIQNPATEVEKIFGFLGFKFPDGIIIDFEKSINKDRSFAFLKDDELLEFYQAVKNKSLVAEMNYHNIR